MSNLKVSIWVQAVWEWLHKHYNITESVDLGTGQMWIGKQYPITIEIVDLATGQEF